jgi:subtilase family serine protease
VSTPGGPSLHHYLSPEGYAARFAPTPRQERQVASWLRSQGFTAVHADAGRSYVRATAPTSTIDAAFRVQLKLYRPSAQVSAGRYPLRANGQAVSIPAALASSVIGITGLDNAAPILPIETTTTATRLTPARRTTAAPHSAPRIVPCSRYYGQHEQAGLPRQFGTTSFPTDACGYSARQVRSTYGARASSAGKGQRSL